MTCTICDYPLQQNSVLKPKEIFGSARIVAV